MSLKWEFWLGNEKIHCLTTATCRAKLRIDMGDNMGRKKKKRKEKKIMTIYILLFIESECLGAYTGTVMRAIACVLVHTNLHTYILYHR